MVLDFPSVALIQRFLQVNAAPELYLFGDRCISLLSRTTHLTAAIDIPERPERPFSIAVDYAALKSALKALGSAPGLELKSDGKRLVVTSEAGSASISAALKDPPDVLWEPKETFSIQGDLLQSFLAQCAAAADRSSDVSSAIRIEPDSDGATGTIVTRSRVSQFRIPAQLPACVISVNSLTFLRFLRGECSVGLAGTSLVIKSPDLRFELPTSQVTVPDVAKLYTGAFVGPLPVRVSDVETLLNSLQTPDALLYIEDKDGVYGTIVGSRGTLTLRLSEAPAGIGTVAVQPRPLKGAVLKASCDSLNMSVSDRFLRIDTGGEVESRHLVIRSITQERS